jgi:hypothetical protein
MMRLGRRATLLAALSLLTSAATAYAECPWVLWAVPYGPPHGDPVHARPGFGKVSWKDTRPSNNARPPKQGPRTW